MDTASTRNTGLAWLAAAALALPLAPLCARADDGPTDRHEIPTFVLKRTELATGAAVTARTAPGPATTATDAALPGMSQ